MLEIEQIPLSKMAVFCYLVADPETKTCALIDPAFDTQRLLELVKKQDYSIAYVINTHAHCDHVAGNASILAQEGRLLIHHQDAGQLNSLLNRCLARILGGKGSPKANQLLHHGDEISIGNGRLKVIHTPGHSPGSICLYTQGHLITGDTLFVGAVGRTDLSGGNGTILGNSIREKIYTLPENTIVWPGHNYSPQPFSTIEQEKNTNPYTKGDL